MIVGAGLAALHRYRRVVSCRVVSCRKWQRFNDLTSRKKRETDRTPSNSAVYTHKLHEN